LAAAASLPAPFVQNGKADVAVVVGSTAAETDMAAAVDIQSYLVKELNKQAVPSVDASNTEIEGEAFPLFTTSTEIYLNDSINVARSILTDDDLPTTLAEGDFSGNVDSDYTQTINLNADSRVKFGQEPTSDDDPTVYINLGTSAAGHLYNASIVFDRAVNFTHADTQGEKIELFGHEWTVGADTTATSLVLYQSSESITLSKGGDSPTPSAEVTVNGESYTIELVAASDTSATIKVTNSAGNSQSKEINEDQSRKINGVEVAVSYADESDTLGLTTEVTVGSQKITLADGEEVKVGSDSDPIDGTSVDFVDTANTGNITQIRVQVFAEDSDNDALLQGGSFQDPAFETFKFSFPGLSIGTNSDDREEISVSNAGDDELQVEFTNHGDDEKKFTYYYNTTNQAGSLSYGDGVREKIQVIENALINRTNYVVVGNQEEGYLLRLKNINNRTSGNGYSDDLVEFEDVFDTSKTYTATITAEGTGSVTIGGKIYSLAYKDATGTADDEYVRLDYPDSSSGKVVVYPTIETSQGAKLALYEPITVNLASGAYGSAAVTDFLLPDGEDYADDVDIALGGGLGNFTVEDTVVGNGGIINGSTSKAVTIGSLTYNFTYSAANTTKIFLVNPNGGGNIVSPAVVVFEEEEDRTNSYNALVVIAEGLGTDSDGIGVSTVVATNGMNGAGTYTTFDSDNDLSQLMTTFGTIVSKDDSESDQSTVKISYPDDQVQAMVYFAESSAVISDGNSTSSGVMVVKDSEASSVSGKNLVVVGGSCVNTVAAELLGLSGQVCGSDWETATGVGAGSYLIQTFSRTGGKVATLVAGYNAPDTTNAAKAFTTQNVDASAGKKYTGTVATQITMATV
jgi:hypothetical protein